MVKPENMPSVRAFLDARAYLKAAYDARRAADRAFSQRRIAQALQAGSSSFFHDVISGKSPLTPARVLGFARLFRLTRSDTDYFEKLVAYTQAEGSAAKACALARLDEADARARHTLLEASHAEYFSKWYYAAVREVLAIHDFRGDYAELGRQLKPALTEETAREAVALLARLKLIHKTAHGGYEPTGRVVLSGPGNVPGQLRPVLVNHLELARRALDAVPAAARPFSYLTLSVSEKSLERIRKKIRALRDEVFEIVTADDEVDRLYQLNFQLFPISEVIARRKS